MTARRLILQGVLGNRLGHSPHTQIDASDIPHANATVAVYLVIQEECNLGCWHDTSQISIPPWGES